MLNIFNILEFLKKDFHHIIKFSIVGTTGAGINTGFLWILTDFMGLYYLLSSVFSIELSIIIQFILNDKWTFKERKTTNINQFTKRIIKSNLWRSVGLSINISILYILTEYLCIYYILSNILGILCAFLLNYVLESKLTWKIKK